jgi:hypothetical protein
VLTRVDLSHPSYCKQYGRVALEQEPLQVPNSAPILLSSRSVNALSQILHHSVSLTPIDAEPFGGALGYVCKSSLHLTFPAALGLVSTAFQEITCPTSAPFRVGHMPYPSRYEFRLSFD